MKIKMESRELYNVLDATNEARSEAVFLMKSDHVMLRAQDASNTYLYSSYIPNDAMIEYEAGEFPRVGFQAKQLKSICPKNSNPVMLEIEDHKLKFYKNDREYTLRLLDPETIQGQPEQVPDLDLTVQIENDISWLSDFVDEASSYVYNGQGGAFHMSAQEGILYLWAKKDDPEMVDRIHWEDFDDYNIDWERATPDQKGSMGIEPKEEKVIECIIAVDFADDIKQFGDSTRIEFGCGDPLKAVTTTEAGVMHSWIIPPRFPTNGQYPRMPERIVTERGAL